MSRRTNGEGSIYRRKDGRYEAASYALTTSGARKRIRVYGKTRLEAHQRLLELQAKTTAGVLVPDKNWKLGDYLDYWLHNIVRYNQRSGTYERSASIVRLYLEPELGSVPLTRLSVVMVQSFLNNKIVQGRSLSIVSTIRKTLSAALTQAQREELVVRNAARLVRLPTYEPQIEVVPWTTDELKKFLDAALDDPLYPVFLLLALYGLRRGEALGLRWCDVDFEEDVLRIRQQLHRVGRELQQGPLKTRASRRTLPMLNVVRQALEAQRQQLRRSGALVSGEEGETQTAGQLVAITRSGLPIEPRNLVRSFRRICEQHGIRRIRVHDMRHTTATLLKNLGIPARDRQLILGHANIVTTQQVYEHDTLDSRRQALGAIEDLFWRATGSLRCRQMRQILPSTSLNVERM